MRFDGGADGTILEDGGDPTEGGRENQMTRRYDIDQFIEPDPAQAGWRSHLHSTYVGHLRTGATAMSVIRALTTTMIPVLPPARPPVRQSKSHRSRRIKPFN